VYEIPDAPADGAYDFDAWNDTAEDGVLRELAATQRIKYIISRDGAFVARFPDGRIIHTPLHLSAETIDTVNGLGDKPEADQIRTLLELLGQAEDLDYLKKTDLISVADYAGKYFRAFERLSQMTLGESQG
jgi:hypothetical protein